MNTSEKIRKLRIEKGLSQEALGQLAGVQRAAINKYEKGRVVNIKRSTLQKLADALGVSPADLLDDVEQKIPGYSYAAGPKESDDISDLINVALGLDDNQLEQLIKYAEFLSQEEK